MPIITFANHKGGTGKSTTTLNVAAGLALQGKKVLMIDLDPQTNLSVMVGIFERQEVTMYEIMTEATSIQEGILEIQSNLWLVPSSLDLSVADLEISTLEGRENILKSKLEEIQNKFDWILIDAPPSMSLLTINGLVASSLVFIPVQTEFIALNGLTKFVEIVEKISELNNILQIGGIIPTRYDQRKVLNRGVVEKIHEMFPDKIMKSIIRENIAIAESVAGGMDIFSYAPKSNGAQDYKKLVDEILLITK